MNHDHLVRKENTFILEFFPPLLLQLEPYGSVRKVVTRRQNNLLLLLYFVGQAEKEGESFEPAHLVVSTNSHLDRLDKAAIVRASG